VRRGKGFEIHEDGRFVELAIAPNDGTLEQRGWWSNEEGRGLDVRLETGTAYMRHIDKSRRAGFGIPSGTRPGRVGFECSATSPTRLDKLLATRILRISSCGLRS
jgi:hypothetical protein